MCYSLDNLTSVKFTDQVCNLVVVNTPYQHTRNCDTQVYISEQSDQVPGTTVVPFFLQALSTHFGGNIMHHATLQASESSSLKSIKK